MAHQAPLLTELEGSRRIEGAGFYTLAMDIGRFSRRGTHGAAFCPTRYVADFDICVVQRGGIAMRILMSIAGIGLVSLAIPAHAQTSTNRPLTTDTPSQMQERARRIETRTEPRTAPSNPPPSSSTPSRSSSRQTTSDQGHTEARTSGPTQRPIHRDGVGQAQDFNRELQRNVGKQPSASGQGTR